MENEDPLRFVIVEDEIILAMDIEGMIEEAGHVIVGQATSLHSFEKLGEESKPDIALVDVHLAGNSSGIDVSRLIRRRWPDAVIVFVTANPTKIPEDFAGACGVVAKPFSRGSFMSVIEYVSEGVRHPPPSSETPKGFAPSPQAEKAYPQH